MSLYEKFRELGLCKRCSYRYMGVRDATAYEIDCKLEEIKSINGEVIPGENPDEPPIKKQKENICIICLGLLQDLINEESIKEICERIDEQKYDSPYIACGVSLPIAMQIRSHSFMLYLKNELSDIYDSKRHVVPIKEAWKWTCSKRVAKGCGKELNSGAICDFLVNSHIDYEDDNNECNGLKQIHSNSFVERKKHFRKFRGEMFTRQNIESLLDKTSNEKFQKYYASPPEIPSKCVKYSKIICTQNSLFIGGRYNKYSRELCQTPWVIEDKRRIDGSIQEFISKPIEELVKSNTSKFQASGREDVDVRTLGRGRPFAIELLDPHKIMLTKEELKNIQNKINEERKGLIEVRDLQIVQKEELSELKSGEEEKCKDYQALCISIDKPVDELNLEKLVSIKDLELSQKTPIRVLHRRNLATRSRFVYDLSGKKIDDKHFLVNLRTQAGTYVKEFVHGDFGRTTPNLGTLLNANIDILALDVREIELNWPSQID